MNSTGKFLVSAFLVHAANLKMNAQNSLEKKAPQAMPHAAAAPAADFQATK